MFNQVTVLLQVAVQEYELAVQYNPQYWESHQRLGRLLAADASLGSQQNKDRMKKVWTGQISSYTYLYALVYIASYPV